MGSLPFEASFDALAHIVEEIRTVSLNPEAAGLVPGLDPCAWKGSCGACPEHHLSCEHFGIDWHCPQLIADRIGMNVLGRRIFVHPATLKRLAGKRLAIQTVKSSGRRVLVAVHT
jgi:hypothetical protein